MFFIEDNVTDPNINNASNTPTDLSETDNEPVWIYVDSFLFIVIVSGNVLTILAIAWARKLRNVISNYFVLNLAVADLLVGVTLLYNLAFYVNRSLNRNKTICISRFVIVSLAFGGSICNLIAIAVDRYIAIVHPLSYNMYATRKRVLIILAIAWTCTMGMSLIPIYWKYYEISCELYTILYPRTYIMFILLPSFLLSWIAMFLLYWKIWREAHMHARRMNRGIIPLNITEKNDRKSVQVVLLILGCFSICWLPYIIMACIRVFGPGGTISLAMIHKFTFALAVANSGMNPFIYAWKNTNFRKAFQKILRFKSPNTNLNSSFKMYLENQRELKNQQTNIENDIHKNGNLHGYSSSRQSNLAEENRVNNTIF